MPLPSLDLTLPIIKEYNRRFPVASKGTKGQKSDAQPEAAEKPASP